MREIKFRAWDIKNKEMLEDATELFRHDWTNPFTDKDYVCLQFTGLKDCFKNDIYEGDIVTCKDLPDKKWIVEYRIDDEFIGFLPKEIGTKDVSHFISWKVMEKIGTVYENPELLK